MSGEIAPKPTGLPLFLRVFGLMMLTLLLVQALNFAVLWLSPPPRPPMATAGEVAATLRGTAMQGLILDRGSDPAHDSTQPQARRIRDAVAARLGIAQGDVRVGFDGFGPGPRFMGPGDPGPPPPPPGPDAPPGPHRLDEPREPAMVFGDFRVSARIDGQWRTVRPARSEMSPWRWRALLWLAVAMIVVAPFAWLLARGVARPIRLFADAAERLGRDPRAPPLFLEGPREIVHAAQTFNAMQGRLSRYVEDRTTLMAAIAHDLRTPLMRLGLRLENAPTDLREAAERDIGEMQGMIAAVMAFLRDLKPAPRRRLDLLSLAHSVCDHFHDLGAEVTLEDGDPVILNGDMGGLKSLLTNLVGNAVKYAGSAEIRLLRGDGAVTIEVRDSGPGMAPEDIDRAFEPFFRAEASRNRDTGGIGLGLASVRAVARAHGGDATLANRPEGGLVARITLPA